MKIQSLVAAVLLGGMLASPAFAANSQQDKMKACNTQAAGKTGDERKAFMKDCLSKKKAEADAAKKKAADEKKEAKKKADDEKKAARTKQQEKMKSCNKEAGDKKMKGDDRKAFMKECLSTK